ncbi:MAG: RDD family protein, partial [Phycicoccus sp.]
VGSPGRLSVTTAARRQVISVVATVVGLVPLIGVLGTVMRVLDPAWLLWDPKRQALHDKVADTVVVIRRGR